MWQEAAVADRFWISEQERWPSEQTEVLVSSDGGHLYFAFKVHDRQPDGIEALKTRRDAGLGYDDQVAVQLDPFLSFREISTYGVNAIGTQSDAIAGGRARQRAWKGDWRAAVARTEYGWSAEIAIPFRILNFPQGTETIGVNFLRYHHRTKEWSRWADITVRARPEEMGRLTDLEPPTAGKAQPWTLLPYVLAGRNIPDRDGDLRSGYATGGVDIRYEPRRNLTGVVSLYPDFSQIESSITDIDFSYTEKALSDPRVFFQEGSAYFGRNDAYFYSNRIPDFRYGGKAFARPGPNQLGALVTRASDDRTDYVFTYERQFDRTHRVGGLIVGTDQADLRNSLYVLRAYGRQPRGFEYAFDGALTRTSGAGGDGNYLRGKLGWSSDHWSVGGTLDRYTTFYSPRNGLLASDLPDTQGGNAFLNYYRDFGPAAIREATGTVSWTDRRTGDGRLQRRNLYVGGSIESRQEVKLSLYYSDGRYRPVGDAPGVWSETVNDDHYWTASLDFDTRRSRLGYGVSYSDGFLGGDDYRYGVAYIWGRPTRTTFISLTAEKLENFGTYRQSVLSGGWDVSTLHELVARYVHADYGDQFRVAWTWRARKNVDLFTVYDWSESVPYKLSAKVVVTLP